MHGSTGNQHPPPLVPRSVHSRTLGHSQGRHAVQDLAAHSGIRSGPRNLDSGLSEISIVFQAAVPKPVVPKYTTSGVRRPSEL